MRIQKTFGNKIVFLLYTLFLCSLLSAIDFSYQSAFSAPHIVESLLYVLFAVVGGIIWNMADLIQIVKSKHKKLRISYLVFAFICILIALIRVWMFTGLQFVPFPSLLTNIINIKFFEIFFGFTAGDLISTCITTE